MSQGITEEEIRRIKNASSVAARLIILGFLIFLFFVSALAYFAVVVYSNMIAFGSALFFISFLSYLFLLKPLVDTLFYSRVQLNDKGIKLPPARPAYGKTRRKILGTEVIIRYEWIENVVLNSVMGLNVYCIIFFSKGGKEYVTMCAQRSVDDLVELVKEMRGRGIEVKILGPSLKNQKMQNEWIADMMHGRELVR